MTVNYVESPKTISTLGAEPVVAADAWDQGPTGLWVPPRRRRRFKRPVGIDLFAGAGGFSLGMHQAGIHVIAAVELEVDAALTYTVNLADPNVRLHFETVELERKFERRIDPGGKIARALTQGGLTLDPELLSGFPTAGCGWISSRLDHRPGACAKHITAEPGESLRSLQQRRMALCESNHGAPTHRDGCEHFWIWDASRITGAMLLEPLGLEPGQVDVVFGGPPCQGFSYAGKRDVMDPRNSLVFEFTRLVSEIRPKSFVMENVRGITSMRTPSGMPVLDALALDLEERGWGTRQAIEEALASRPGAGAATRATGRPTRSRNQAPKRNGRSAPKPPKQRRGPPTSAPVGQQAALF